MANEMIRMNTNILPQWCVIPVVLTLLNVRSDILADETLSSLYSVSWLNAPQCSPLLRADQIDIRCDKVTCVMQHVTHTHNVTTT